MIVLVITIIVIIILAVAVILTLSNNNPIENAKKAVSANDEATIKEAATIIYSDWYMKKNLDGEDVGDAEDYVKEQLGQQGFSPELINRLTVTNEGKITIATITDEVTVVEGVTIPKGFKHVEGTTVSTGLVIENTTDNNQFVWVPVEEGTFVRESFSEEWTLDTTEYVEPYEEEGYTTEREEYDAMVASVSQYGGFYIGRYEASKNTTSGKAQSIPNETPWNLIRWGTSMTEVGTTGAVAKAREVYPDSSTKVTGDAISILPYGVQWDATVRFILTQYSEEILSDSTGYGNYSLEDEEGNYVYDASLIPTGSNDDYKLNNIYDIAGNVWEYTMERCINIDESACVMRGGSFVGSSILDPVATRNNSYFSDEPSDNIGFRIALYIK